jgi:hypothetical protein
MNPDSNVVCVSVFRVALVMTVTAALGCGSSSTEGAADGGRADAGKDSGAKDVTRTSDVAVDQSSHDVDSKTDAAGGDVPRATDVAVDRSVDGAADDVPKGIDVAPGIDVSKAEVPLVELDGAAVDSNSVDVADAPPARPARITFAFKNAGAETVYLQI